MSFGDSFRGVPFTFGCDGNEVQIPVTYREFLKKTGLEIRKSEYAPDPEDEIKDGDYTEGFTLYIPGTDEMVGGTLFTASYTLDERGVRVYLKDKNGRQQFEGKTYGDCLVTMVYCYYFYDNEVADYARLTFAGIEAGASREEVYERFGEPTKQVTNTSVDYVMFEEGDRILTFGFSEDRVNNLEIYYEPV